MNSDIQNNTQAKLGNQKVGAVYAPTESPVVSPFDPRQSGKLTRAQLNALEELHQSCAIRISDSLGVELRSTVEVSLASVEQVSGAELLDRTLKQAFASGFIRIEFSVRADNLRALRLYEKLGFVKEGVLRDAVFVDGEFHDTISMALINRGPSLK